MKPQFLLATVMAVSTASAVAATYTIDPTHTYPSFEADHMGLSVWRGKFDKTSGTVTLDRAARTGALDITIDAASVNFGLDKMNSHARSPAMFNVEKFPTVSYHSKTFQFNGDRPVTVQGELTMLGITRPVALTINKFKCAMHPMLKREVCGADASAEFKCTDFGMSFNNPAFSPEVRLAIQVEAIKSE